MDRLLAAVKAHAGSMDQQSAQPRFATVQNVDPTTYRAKVLIQPEGVLTGWLPIGSSSVGNGWGMAFLPAQGQQVVVLPVEGSADNGVVMTLAYSTPNPPPKTFTSTDGSGNTTEAQPGEFLLRHQNGVFLRILSDKVLINGDVYTVGDLHVHGDVYDRHGSLDRLRQNYDAHKHLGVQTGTGTTGLTDHNDPE